MTKKIIDLSVALETGIISDPPMALPKIDYVDHANSAEQICSFFPGLEKEDLPGGEGWAVEQLTISTHNGTHLDAPYHFHLRWTEEKNHGPLTRFRWNGASIQG